MFEELKIYLDLVEKFGDPFTTFERDWPEDEEETPVFSGRHVLTEQFRAVPPAAPSPVPRDPAMSAAIDFGFDQDVGFAG